MPTYDTPNSQHTYEVPDAAAAVDILVRGGVGGSGYDSGSSGGAGGPGGIVSGRLSVGGGETLSIYVGEDGTDGGTASDEDGSPGASPYNGGLSGGAGEQEPGFYTIGGGGAAPSALVCDGSGLVALGEGGGGGGSGYDLQDDTDGGGGGGGARGGQGAGGAGNGDGSGDGGNGGEGGSFGGAPEKDGGAGGTTVDSSLTNVSTSTSTAGPVVEIVPRYPPARVTDLQVTGIRDTELDLAWTDRDGVSGTDPEDGYRIYTTRVGTGDRVEQADLPADTEQHTLTGLLTGERYYVEVVAYNDVGEVGDIVADVPVGTTETVPSGETETEIGQHGIAGTHEIRGTHEKQQP